MTRAYRKQANGSIFGTKKKKIVQYYRKPKLKNRKMKPPCGYKHILPAMLKNHWSHWNTKVFSRIYFRVKCKGFAWDSLTPMSNSSLSGQKWSPVPLNGLGDHPATMLWLKEMLFKAHQEKEMYLKCWDRVANLQISASELPPRVWDAVSSSIPHTLSSYCQVDCRWPFGHLLQALM